MSRTGRPTELTPELQAEFVKLLANGNFPDFVADALGIDRSTYYRWMNRGKLGEQPFCDFRDEVRRARAEGKRSLLAAIQKAALEPKHWTAAAWLLQRMDDRFIQKTETRVRRLKDPTTLKDDAYWAELERNAEQALELLAERKRELASNGGASSGSAGGEETRH